ERKKAEQERVRAEQERMRAEQERMRAEQERQRAEKLEQEKERAELAKIESIRLMLEMGVPLEKIYERLKVDEGFLKRNNLI
ncbi:MAG: hypothetical protein NZ516_12975, partial [Raineya sp.]|nr:hypothetical protein [Raineya sp.]